MKFVDHCLCAWIYLAALFSGAALAQTENRPDWSDLDRYQETISADTFARLLNEVYSPDAGMINYLQYGESSVAVFSSIFHTNEPLLRLRFAPADAASPALINREDAHIALDPGHIGGAWSRMEERFFLVDRHKDWPVQEAAMNLYVARLIRDRLEAAGVRVTLVKDDFEPMSETGPDALLARMTEETLPPADTRFEHLPELFALSSRKDQQRKAVEREFYRTAEIAARARRVNEEIKPDATLCIHFNATGYGDEKTLHEENGLTFFVHGNYLARELESDDQKFYLLNKLLERSHELEVGLTESIVEAFVAATGLPPSYRLEPGGVMHPVDPENYIYARNLAANRQFAGPVIFLEPYFMNNLDVYARIQAGDYEGEREINGKLYPSIFREYADAVATGVIRYFSPD